VFFLRETSTLFAAERLHEPDLSVPSRNAADLAIQIQLNLARRFAFSGCAQPFFFRRVRSSPAGISSKGDWRLLVGPARKFLLAVPCSFAGAFPAPDQSSASGCDRFFSPTV